MIVHIISSLKVGGAEMMLKKLLLTRQQNGFDDAVICLTSKGKVGDDLSNSGLKVYYLNMSILNFPVALFNLFKLTKSLNTRVIQTWLYHADFFGSLVSVVYRIPIIWNIRQTQFSSKKSFTYLLMKLCAKLSFFIPRYVICAAENSRKSHINYGYDANKMLVIHNGFDVQTAILKQTTVTDGLHLKKTNFLVGIVGRYHFDKDYASFVKASYHVLQVFPNTDFIMVGRELNSGNNELLDLINKFSVINRFRLHGESDQLQHIYPELDVFVLSSINEGFPNVIGEAMMYGIPCVSTDVGDTEFIIGDTGIVTPKGDPAQLSNAICQILALSETERNRLGEKARERIIQNFSIATTVSKYSILYERFAKS
jgi:glycosyltransferase involved in cell wall biosynthesis